jgi:hypothetical protein
MRLPRCAATEPRLKWVCKILGKGEHLQGRRTQVGVMSFLSRKPAEYEYASEVEAPQMARVTGLLYGCGAAFAAASIALRTRPPPTPTGSGWSP